MACCIECCCCWCRLRPGDTFLNGGGLGIVEPSRGLIMGMAFRTRDAAGCCNLIDACEKKDALAEFRVKVGATVCCNGEGPGLKLATEDCSDVEEEMETSWLACQ
jgi:hypothetical protein